MTLSELNLSLFSWINASPEATNTSIHFAIFIANDLLYCMILLFAWFWLRGNYDTKKQILKAFIFTSSAILISQCISHVYYHPRPFVMEVGRTLIYHAPNGSFPSDHMLIFSWCWARPWPARTTSSRRACGAASSCRSCAGSCPFGMASRPTIR